MTVIAECLYAPSVHFSLAHLHGGPRCTSSVCGLALRSHQNRTGAVLFCCRLFTRLGVFAQLQEENGENGGHGGGVWGGGGAGGGACQSWQVDSICIWHTDCTKYVNRQTMGIFCVIPLLQYFSLPTESTQKGSRRPASRPALPVVCTALPGAYTCQVRPSF